MGLKSGHLCLRNVQYFLLRSCKCIAIPGAVPAGMGGEKKPVDEFWLYGKSAQEWFQIKYAHTHAQTLFPRTCMWTIYVHAHTQENINVWLNNTVRRMRARKSTLTHPLFGTAKSRWPWTGFVLPPAQTCDVSCRIALLSVDISFLFCLDPCTDAH